MSVPLIPSSRLWVFGLSALVVIAGAALVGVGFPSGLYPFQWVLFLAAWFWGRVVEPEMMHAEIAAYLRGNTK